MRSSIPQVALLVETSTTWGAQVVQGVADFGREHGPWSIFVESRGIHERLRVPPDWRGEGIIARVTTRRLAQQVQALGVPCVNISWSHVDGSDLPRVVPDEQAVGRMAAEHLISRGFRQFAYVGLSDQPHYVDGCGPAFARALAERGFECAVYGSARRSDRFADLSDWLAGRPRPFGVLAWDSARGRRVAEACAVAGIRIPEDVGVISGYNDDLMCAIAIPPLSCVDHCPLRIGYEAAALLARLMAGESTPAQPQLIPPAGVIARRSTDALVIDDPAVSDAVQYIRQNVHELISVDDLLKVVPVSRRSLELRFLRALGRSPAAEIRRARVEHAMDLLAKTDQSIARVAAASGFNYTEVMNRVFRRELGMTPTMYRRQFQSR